MATASRLPGNKVAEDKDRFTNYNIETHVNQITAGLQNDRKKIEETEEFYVFFCTSVSETRGFLSSYYRILTMVYHFQRY
jgi:hypothetical protein